MSRLSFTRLAEQDLIGILEFVGKDRPQAANKWYANLRERCTLLAENPELGELRPDLDEQVRSFTVKRWVIYYRVVGDEVVIDRVLDGSQDVRTQLRQS